MRFADKVCLVTGGGSGIGKAACIQFAVEGGKVAVADLEQSAAAAAICFLASPEARFITGTNLTVDGGRLDILP